MSDTNPIITSVESLQIENSTGVIISPATEEKQDSLETLTQSIYELIERLSFLTSIRDTTSSLRSSITNTPNIGILTTVTTVSTLSNMASVWGFLANPQIPWMMNNTAIQSNISNITI